MQDDLQPFPDTLDEIVAHWAHEFRLYRERVEHSGLDLWMELAGRLARVGVHPGILRQDIDHRLARGWSVDVIGTVLDALATETYRTERVPNAKHLESFARALFDAMTERDPCSLTELAKLCAR